MISKRFGLQIRFSGHLTATVTKWKMSNGTNILGIRHVMYIRVVNSLPSLGLFLLWFDTIWTL